MLHISIQMSQLLCLCFWFVQRVCQSGMVETRLGVLEDVISPKLIDLSSITLQRMPERRKICPKNPLWHIKTILMDYSINPYNKEQEEGKFQLTIFYSIPWNFWMRYVLNLFLILGFISSVLLQQVCMSCHLSRESLERVIF